MRVEIGVLVVDDGSPEPARIGDKFPWPVSIIRLPGKTQALNPSVPFNVGVAASHGYIIVLTNPEVIHREAILPAMRDRLNDLGPKGYVIAACMGPGWWYCHSTDMPSDNSVGRSPTPPGSGFHFCSMLRRSLYDEIGGFSEEYRDGQGFEDNDFLWKLHKAGAKFEICDDLVTDHFPCPRSNWVKGGGARNKAIFEKAWHVG